MVIYAINYTLRSPKENHQSLVVMLRSFPLFCHVQNGFWIVQSPLDKDAIFQKLTAVLVPGDELFIMVYTNGGATWTGNQNESLTRLQDMLFDPQHERHSDND
ncbi:MAG: hypothetical protein ABF747_05585 [Bifidobacterium sp.]|uniref:Uncharacterized protein n=2 Tax=Bifidobacterium fermentum TaxID=3059035 RepID=A0AB39UMC4_9BIFI